MAVAVIAGHAPRSLRYAGAPPVDRGLDEVVAVAISDDRDEQLTRDQRARIVRRAVDDHVVADDCAIHHRRDLRRSKLHDGSLSEATTLPSCPMTASI